jgi:hypothetical protein
LNANQKAKELSRNLFSQFLGQHGLPDLEQELPKHLVVRLITVFGATLPVDKPRGLC